MGEGIKESKRSESEGQQGRGKSREAAGQNFLLQLLQEEEDSRCRLGKHTRRTHLSLPGRRRSRHPQATAAGITVTSVWSPQDTFVKSVTSVGTAGGNDSPACERLQKQHIRTVNKSVSGVSGMWEVWGKCQAHAAAPIPPASLPLPYVCRRDPARQTAAKHLPARNRLGEVL